MLNFNEETLAKAKYVKSVEELLALAQENDMELTEEQAQLYFAQLNLKSGELTDEELDNVAGGGCYSEDGTLVVSAILKCEFWLCQKCRITTERVAITGVRSNDSVKCGVCGTVIHCASCSYCIRQGGILLCTNQNNRKH